MRKINSLETYEKYLNTHPNDEDIARIMNDQILHSQELHNAIAIIC